MCGMLFEFVKYTRLYGSCPPIALNLDNNLALPPVVIQHYCDRDSIPSPYILHPAKLVLGAWLGNSTDGSSSAPLWINFEPLRVTLDHLFYMMTSRPLS